MLGDGAIFIVNLNANPASGTTQKPESSEGENDDSWSLAAPHRELDFLEDSDSEEELETAPPSSPSPSPSPFPSPSTLVIAPLPPSSPSLLPALLPLSPQAFFSVVSSTTLTIELLPPPTNLALSCARISTPNAASIICYVPPSPPTPALAKLLLSLLLSPASLPLPPPPPSDRPLPPFLEDNSPAPVFPSLRVDMLDPATGMPRFEFPPNSRRPVSIDSDLFEGHGLLLLKDPSDQVRIRGRTRGGGQWSLCSLVYMNPFSRM